MVTDHEKKQIGLSAPSSPSGVNLAHDWKGNTQAIVWRVKQSKPTPNTIGQFHARANRENTTTQFQITDANHMHLRTAK